MGACASPSSVSAASAASSSSSSPASASATSSSSTHDTVDETNLPRLFAAEPDDIDKPKTYLAARNARRANPDIKLTIIQTRVETPLPAAP